jgi:hypothetical protein
MSPNSQISFVFFAALSSFVLVWGYVPLREPGSALYGDPTFLQDAMERMNRDFDSEGFFDLGASHADELGAISGAFLPGRSTKDVELMANGPVYYDMMSSLSGHPSLRDQEYLQHSASPLWGNKYMQGGTGELKVKGTKVPSEVKTDAVLPAYCNPPNPCPVGYTADDGCLETFENSAAFSRAYQASQDCMCDTEHMFDCPAMHDGDDNELEMSQRDFLNAIQGVEGEHKTLVAKKFYNSKMYDQKLNHMKDLARHAAALASPGKPEMNPFLQGEKLPIAAKKGHHTKQ